MNKEYKKLAIAFSGPSNTGKTTLIVKISTALKKQGFKVCIIKHDPKNKATFDKEGKDSYKFSQTGADVAVLSPEKTTIFKNEMSSLDEIIKIFKDFDFLLVEGLKNLELPRISLFRNKADESYFKYSNAIAIDESVDKKSIPNDLEILDLNDTSKIITWIEKNAKRV